jgi:bacterioferritin-associated ferredoxin
MKFYLVPMHPPEVICSCTLATYGQVHKLAQQNLSFEDIVRRSGACSGCGSCQFEIEELMEEVGSKVAPADS